MVAVMSARPLAAAHCRALAAWAVARGGWQVPQERGHLLQIDWRKPAVAGVAIVAQWSGATARRSHAVPLPPIIPPDAPGRRLRRQAVRAQAQSAAASHELPIDIAASEEASFDEPVDATEDDVAVEQQSAAALAAESVVSSSLDDTALAALIARTAEHDDKALAALYDATSSRVFGLVSRIVCDNALAEEVVEDTYWQVWRQAMRFDAQRGRPLTWLLAMARSRAIDALRRRDRRALLPLDDEEVAALCDEDGAGPPDLLAATHGQHLLHRALEALEPQPRQLVALAFFRGLTHEEIAGCTGLPLGTVKSQIRRSLQALKQWLAQAGCPDLPL